MSLLQYIGILNALSFPRHQALTLAQQVAHPLSLSFALSFAAVFHQFRREERTAQERAEATMSLAKDQGFPYWMAPPYSTSWTTNSAYHWARRVHRVLA